MPAQPMLPGGNAVAETMPAQPMLPGGNAVSHRDNAGIADAAWMQC